MKVWITLKRNINTQIDNNWCYKTIMQCINMAKLKHIEQWGCILSKGQCYSEKQWILTFTFYSIWCIILEITFITSGLKPQHFPTWIYAQIMLWYIKDTNHVKIALSLQEMKDVIWAETDEISTLYQEIFLEFARPA